jgi:hypothetical protein
MRALPLRPLVVVLLALLLASGCAGHVSSPEASRGLGPCLPAAVSVQFFFWPVVAFRSVNVLTEDGEAAPAAWVVYRKGKTAVAVMWVQSDLVAVDPSPETDAPEWVDLSLAIPMDGKLVLRGKPDAPCRWERWDNGASTFLRRP